MANGEEPTGNGARTEELNHWGALSVGSSLAESAGGKHDGEVMVVVVVVGKGANGVVDGEMRDFEAEAGCDALGKHGHPFLPN